MHYWKRSSKKIKVKDIGRPKQILGTELGWSCSTTVQMRQKNLISKLLKNSGMLGSKPVGSPVDRTLTHGKAMKSENFQKKTIRRTEVLLAMFFP